MGFGQILILLWLPLLVLASLTRSSYGYDILDPFGNITIKWDIMQDNGGTYDVRVSLFNYQLFRHVEPPGWRLSWTWVSNEVIWSMWGAEATLQGNCSRFKGQLPHSCEKHPVIVDLLPGVPYNIQVANCCKGGVLSSFNQDPSRIGAMFQMNVGGLGNGDATNKTDDDDPPSSTIPQNFTLGIAGYTCGLPEKVPPSRFTAMEAGGGHKPWFRAAPAPRCCVSLSAFYNNTIVPCPRCSCSCRGLPGSKCLRDGEAPPVLQLPHGQGSTEEEQSQPLVRCTDHMCPIRVHWHVKQNYKEYWRVKVTITNLNAVKNYSQWNLVVQHPNLHTINRVFSFNYQPLNIHGYINDTGMFWGVQHYNDMLLQSGVGGNVQTEILLGKDASLFTLREGWAFPRKISFNGDDCVMPPPDSYPRLPNAAVTILFNPSFCLLISILILTLL